MKLFLFLILGLFGVDFKSVGIPTEKEIVDKYCREMNIDEIKDWNVYMAFSYFRIAAIVQGVYKRSLQGECVLEQAVRFYSLLLSVQLISDFFCTYEAQISQT